MSTITESLERGVRRPEEKGHSHSSDSPDSGLQTPVCEQPFRHVVIDDWAEPELVRAAEAEWPEPYWPHWHRYENGKLATKDPLRYPPACAEIIRRLLCLPVSELLGIEGTFGDWNCHGGGLHAMPPGSSLGVHLDSDHHPATNWRRAANAVLFVNRHWVSDHAASNAPTSNPSPHGHKPPAAGWGGEFELWNADGRYCLQRIEPRFNRLVLFEPSDVAWHAVAPVRGPETRKTLTVFFWKHGGPGESKRSRAAFAGGNCSHGGM